MCLFIYNSKVCLFIDPCLLSLTYSLLTVGVNPKALNYDEFSPLFRPGKFFTYFELKPHFNRMESLDSSLLEVFFCFKATTHPPETKERIPKASRLLRQFRRLRRPLRRPPTNTPQILQSTSGNNCPYQQATANQSDCLGRLSLT